MEYLKKKPAHFGKLHRIRVGHLQILHMGHITSHRTANFLAISTKLDIKDGGGRGGDSPHPHQHSSSNQHSILLMSNQDHHLTCTPTPCHHQTHRPIQLPTPNQRAWQKNGRTSSPSPVTMPPLPSPTYLQPGTAKIPKRNPTEH